MASFNDDYSYDERQKQTFKSLCYVEANAGTVIKRLADIEADELRPFHVDKNRPSKFDNRGRLYHDNIFPEGFLGVIDWTVEPKRDDPDNDFVPQPIREAQETPILIWPTPSTSDVEDVKERLKVGVRVNVKGKIRTLFVPKRSYQNLSYGLAYVEGAFCALEDCDCEDVDGETVWKLKPKTSFLPVFKISSCQTIEIKYLDKQFRFLNSLNLGTSIKDIAVKTPKEIALDVVNEKWPSVVNAAKELNRGDKQAIKKCFERLPVATIVEEIARRYKCSLEEAESYWEETRRYVDGWIEVEDGDIKAFIELLERNDELRERYYDFWLQQFENQLKEEEEKTKERREATKKELQNVCKQKERVEKERDALIEAQKRLIDETAALESECERKKNALRQIERELSEAIRREWSAAEENAAEFWAKKVVFSTETRRDGANQSDDGKNVRKSSLFTPGTVFRPLETGKIDRFPTAKILEKNLKRRVVSDCNEELEAFVLAAFELGEALILAGPCGERIVDALAAACCEGRRPGTLRCDGDWNEDAVAEAEAGDDEIILVKNALNSRWVDRWPDAVAESSKRWILTTPFEEDLTLLPKGFYNYFAPVLTEMFVVDVNCEDKPLAAGKSVPRDRSNEKIKEVKFNFDGESFGKMRASAFYCKRLEATLKRAYQIGTEILKLDEASQTRLTFLLGVAPFAFATGNLDVLREAFEWEKEKLDDNCRKTIRRLLGDAEE